MSLGPLDLRSGGTIKFRFKTNEPRGILLFTQGTTHDANFMAIEIFDGILYFVYKFGNVKRRIPFANMRVDDGQWHTVSVDLSQRRIRLLLDQRHSQDITRREQATLYFSSSFFGGVTNNNILPWYVWSRNGFQGCMEDLEFKNISEYLVCLDVVVPIYCWSLYSPSVLLYCILVTSFMTHIRPCNMREKRQKVDTNEPWYNILLLFDRII